MNEAAVPPKDRIAAAEIIIAYVWGKPSENVDGGDGRRPLLKVVREIVHLDPVPREEIEREDLLVEWKDITKSNGHDH